MQRALARKKNFFNLLLCFIYWNKVIDDRLWVHEKKNCIFKGQEDSQEGWGMANSMHNMVLVTIKHVVQKVKFFSLNCDEVRRINYQHPWLCTIKNWRSMLLFLNLQMVIKGGGSNNLNYHVWSFLSLLLRDYFWGFGIQASLLWCK
jgi:hypothetical protein